MPLPFHFAFPVFPSLFQPTAILRYEAHEGTIAGLFSSLLHHAASSYNGTSRGKLGARCSPYPCVAHWCHVCAVNQGSRVELGSGEG